MFRRTCFVVVAMAAMLRLLGSTAQSAVPSLMNYGGILTNGSGTPQVGTFSVTFSIYDDAPATNPAL